MSSLTRHLIGDAEMHTLTRVERLEYLGDSWQLKDADEQTICYTRGLIICAPARQTGALLAGTPCSVDWLTRSHNAARPAGPSGVWQLKLTVNCRLRGISHRITASLPASLMTAINRAGKIIFTFG